jgi:hypothetical protein
MIDPAGGRLPNDFMRRMTAKVKAHRAGKAVSRA